MAAESVKKAPDTENAVLEMALESIQELGCGVLAAAEALEILKCDKSVDVFFWDVVMPCGMNVQLASGRRAHAPADENIADVRIRRERIDRSA